MFPVNAKLPPQKWLPQWGLNQGIDTLLLPQVNSSTTFEDCVFHAGLEVRSGLAHCIRRCKVTGSRTNGITVYKGAGALIEECEVFGNHTSGIEVQTAVTDRCVRLRVRLFSAQIFWSSFVQVGSQNSWGEPRAIFCSPQGACRGLGWLGWKNIDFIKGKCQKKFPPTFEAGPGKVDP